MKTKCVVEMEDNQTILYPPTASMNKGDPRWAAQLSFILLLISSFFLKLAFKLWASLSGHHHHMDLESFLLLCLFGYHHELCQKTRSWTLESNQEASWSICCLPRFDFPGSWRDVLENVRCLNRDGQSCWLRWWIMTPRWRCCCKELQSSWTRSISGLIVLSRAGLLLI